MSSKVNTWLDSKAAFDQAVGHLDGLPVEFDSAWGRLALVLQVNRYAQGDGLHLSVADPVTREPFGTLTVNLPEAPLPLDLFWLKDWSENESWARQLIQAYPTLFDLLPKRHATGFVSAQCVRVIDRRGPA